MTQPLSGLGRDRLIAGIGLTLLFFQAGLAVVAVALAGVPAEGSAKA